MNPEEFYQRLQRSAWDYTIRCAKEAVRPIFPSISSGME